MAKDSLCVYLLTEQANTFTAVRPLSDGDPRHRQVWQVADGNLVQIEEIPPVRDATLMVLQYRTAPPKWAIVPERIFGSFSEAPEASSGGILLFQPVDEDVVVWSFGQAWFLIEPTQIVRRFGLYAALNAVLENPDGNHSIDPGIVAISSVLRSAVSRSAHLKTKLPAKAQEIDRLDTTVDGARSVEVYTNSEFGRLAGGSGLRFDALVSQDDDLGRYAREAIRLSRLGLYKSSSEFAWIDNITPVDDPELRTRVLKEIWDKEQAINPVLTWLDADGDPDEIADTVRFKAERSGRAILNWEIFRNWMKKKQADLDPNLKMTSKLRWYRNDELISETEVWQQIVAEVDLDGQHFMVSDADVWIVKKDFIENVDRVVASHATANPKQLPSWNPRHWLEAQYLYRVESETECLNVDQRFLRLEGQTPVELCDLISEDGLPIHVKLLARGTQGISHLTSQAKASTLLLRNDQRARDEAVRIVDEANAERENVRIMPVERGQNEKKQNFDGFPVLSKNRIKTIKRRIAGFGSGSSTGSALAIVGSWSNTPNVGQISLLGRINLYTWIQEAPGNVEVFLVGEGKK